MCNTIVICRFHQRVAVLQGWPISQLLLYTNFTSVLCVLHDPPLFFQYASFTRRLYRNVELNWDRGTGCPGDVPRSLGELCIST